MIIKRNDYIVKSAGVYYRGYSQENGRVSLVIMGADGSEFRVTTMPKEIAEAVINQITDIIEDCVLMNAANPDACLIDLDKLINNI